LDQEMERLLHQRASAVAEEERGRQDILQLAVLVANTEQGIAQLASKVADITHRGDRLSAERDEMEAQRTAAVARHEALR
jgi:chromosome segregation protein